MAKSVLRIALTGGPGGGKTTFIKSFADRLNPWCVITLEDSATALKAECAKVGIKHRSDSADFQQQVLHRQLYAEETAFAVAKTCSKPTILLTDRGMFDSVGFVSFSTYQTLLLRMTLTPAKVLARYDAIFFLRSIVPSGKVTLGRFSQPDSGAFVIHVCNVEDILLKHLSAHPNLIVIDPQDTVDEKIRLTKIAVANTAVKLGHNCQSR